MSFENPPPAYETFTDYGLFYSSTFDSIVRYATRKIGDATIAEELAQEAYLSIYLQEYASWDIRLAYKVTFRKIIDRQRSLKFRNEVYLRDVQDDPDFTDRVHRLAVDGHISPQFQIESSEAVEEISVSLRPDYYAMLVLDSEDRSHQEIGQLVGKSESGVKSALFKARKEAQTILAVKGL